MSMFGRLSRKKVSQQFKSVDGDVAPSLDVPGNKGGKIENPNDRVPIFRKKKRKNLLGD